MGDARRLLLTKEISGAKIARRSCTFSSSYLLSNMPIPDLRVVFMRPTLSVSNGQPKAK